MITVQGVALSSLAYGISTRTGWRSSPGVRAAEITAANADGVIVPDRRAPLEPGQFGLSMWVRGRTFAEFTSNLDTLMVVFSTQSGTVPVTMDVDQGVTRVCQARTVASWSVDHVAPLHAQFNVVMEIPAGAWTSEDYYTRAASFAGEVRVLCDDPTALVTDSQLLMRDTGSAVDLIVYDVSVDLTESQRVFARLVLDEPLVEGRSLLWDLGGWRVVEIAQPDAEDVTPAWFDASPAVLVDHTADVYRQGPMWGRALLPLQPGGIVPPRDPGVGVIATDADTIPTTVPGVTLAVRPRWL